MNDLVKEKRCKMCGKLLIDEKLPLCKRCGMESRNLSAKVSLFLGSIATATLTAKSINDEKKKN